MPAARWVTLAVCAAHLACQPGAPPWLGAEAARPPSVEKSLQARAFFRDPVLDRVAFSPDGERLVAIASREGLQVVLEMRLADGAVRFLKKIDEPGMWVRTLGWSGEDVVLVAFDRPQAAVVQSTRTSRMLALRLDGRRPRDYGTSWTYQSPSVLSDGILHWLPADREHVLVNWWHSDREGASVQRVRVRSGIREAVVPAERWMRTYFADTKGRVRAAEGLTREGTQSMVYARRTVEDPFRPLSEADLVRDDRLEFAGFATDPDLVYLRAVAANGRKALIEYALTDWTRGRVVFAHPEVDVGALVHAPDDGALVAVEVDAGRPELHFVDEEAARWQAAIEEKFPGATARITGWDRAGRRALVRVSGDRTPPQYYTFDAERREMRFLFSAYPDLDTTRLAAMEPITYPARDGVRIPGYLTLPVGAKPPLPAILVPHGGPSTRDRWGWDARVQYLASRGFAVLQPNYRGSRGYGRDHEDAGYDQWGGVMQEDLEDGARWLVAEGIADPEAMGIFGAGYGGYAALMGVARTPELFRAAASLGGVTDLLALLDEPDELRSDDFNRPIVSPLPRHVERLRETSPVHQAGRIRAPVLLAHGSEDPVVDPDQSRRMRDALEEAGVPVESHVYANELNRFLEERNRIEFHEKLADFFARHLRGGTGPPDP